MGGRYFKLAGKYVKIKSKEKPRERKLPSGNILKPIEIKKGTWVFKIEEGGGCVGN